MIVGRRTLPRTFVLVVPRLPVEEMITGTCARPLPARQEP
jgi:hypothetical protein